MKKTTLIFLSITLLLATLMGCSKQHPATTPSTPLPIPTDAPTKSSISDFNIVTAPATKVILDCDMSYVNDDAFALMFLHQADRLGYIDLLGVTASGGNKIGAVAVNATLLQLEAVGRTDIPVYIGRDEPLLGFNPDRAALTDWPGEVYSNLDRYISPDDYHNLGDHYIATWGYSQTNAQSESASDFMIEQVSKNPGEITILCIGPTTNVAMACLADESFAANTAGIIYMGGKLSEDASFNWWYDADAVKICLESAFPTQIVCTSEISGNMHIPSGFMDNLAQYDSSAIARFFVTHKTIAIGNKKLWDVAIPAIFMCPELIATSEKASIAVSVEDATYGQMLFTEDDTEATIVSEIHGGDLFILMELLFGTSK